MSEMRKIPVTPAGAAATTESGFVRSMGLFDSTTMVVGSMIGSGIFIVSADIARQTGSTGWLLLAWIVTGVLTVTAALSYGELAAMMPKAGGQYVYLRESYSPLWGFLYGWTLFLVIQTGTIAAVAVAFARYLGVLAPSISPTAWIVPPIDLSAKYAISLSSQQFVAILLIVFLTAANTRGLRLGKLIQNIFTSAKTLALVGADRPGRLHRAQRRCHRRQFLRHLGRAERPDHPARRGFPARLSPGRLGRDRRLRPADRLRRGPGRLAVLRRRLEQHHLHRRRGEESAAQRPALARAGHGHRDRCSTCWPTSPISATLPLGGDPDRPRRPRRHRRAQRRSSAARAPASWPSPS